MARFKPITEDLPAYRNVPEYGTVLVGTVHDAICYADGKDRRKKFLVELGRANHLILECQEGEIELASSVESTSASYEVFAFSEFDGKPLYLEGNRDAVLLLNRYGCRRDLFGAYSVLSESHRMEIQKDARELGKTEYDLYWFRLQLTQSSRAYINFSVNKSLAVLRKILTDPVLGSKPELIDAIGEEFLFFHSGVREVEVLGPNARDLCVRLRGNKFVILGYLHLDRVSKYVKGESIDPAMTWQQVIETADPVVRDAILRIENELVPPVLE